MVACFSDELLLSELPSVDVLLGISRKCNDVSRCLRSDLSAAQAVVTKLEEELAVAEQDRQDVTGLLRLLRSTESIDVDEERDSNDNNDEERRDSAAKIDDDDNSDCSELKLPRATVDGNHSAAHTQPHAQKAKASGDRASPARDRKTNLRSSSSSSLHRRSRPSFFEPDFHHDQTYCDHYYNYYNQLQTRRYRSDGSPCPDYHSPNFGCRHDQYHPFDESCGYPCHSSPEDNNKLLDHCWDCDDMNKTADWQRMRRLLNRYHVSRRHVPYCNNG